MRLGYGSLPPPTPATTQWEKKADPYMLLLQVGLAAGKQVIALALLFFQVLNERQLLMTCDSRIIGRWTYLCEYTKTFVRCFPLFAASVTLMVGSRSMLQQRIYYGLLKRDALLDFENTKAWHDPLFYILLLCFVHGVAHFALDLSIDEGFGAETGSEKYHEAVNMVKNYILPAMIFFAFLCTSYDVEAILVPLSKYFEEDPVKARQAAGQLKFMDERDVDELIPQLSVKIPHVETTLEATYREIIKRCPEHGRAPDLDEQKKCTKGFRAAAKQLVQWQLLKTMWPSKILLDPQLLDAEAGDFRKVFLTVSGASSLVILGTFVYFVYQAKKDALDVMQGQYEDGVSLAVLCLHAAVIAWMFKVSVMAVWKAREKIPVELEFK